MSGSDQKPKDKPSAFRDVVNQGKDVVRSEEGWEKDRAKRAANESAEVAKGTVEEVIGSAKMGAGIALGNTDLIDAGLDDKAAGKRRREHADGTTAVQDAGESFAEKAHDLLTGMGGAVRRTFKHDDEKDK
jgi:uncharacterized protein YjbJ (UPF0337 family)